EHGLGLALEQLDERLAWQPEVAKEQVARALRLSPLDSHRSSMFAAMAAAHFMTGSYDEALAWMERAAREHRGGVLFSAVLVAASAALAGNIDRAREALDQLRSAYPDMTISKQSLSFPFRRPQDIARLAEGLRKAGLPE